MFSTVQWKCHRIILQLENFSKSPSPISFAFLLFLGKLFLPSSPSTNSNEFYTPSWTSVFFSKSKYCNVPKDFLDAFGAFSKMSNQQRLVNLTTFAIWPFGVRTRRWLSRKRRDFLSWSDWWSVWETSWFKWSVKDESNPILRIFPNMRGLIDRQTL